MLKTHCKKGARRKETLKMKLKFFINLKKEMRPFCKTHLQPLKSVEKKIKQG
jgi:hypothetical protein